VRNHNEGEAVVALEYEAHEPIANREGEKIISEARQRFAILAAHCRHRAGKLAIGDCAVWVGVSAAHRGAAFDACRYIIDETKRRVPIWKKEHYRDGHSAWVNCATEAVDRAAPTDRVESANRTVIGKS
jgi:molybdopterin synthase catalytic subunit